MGGPPNGNNGNSVMLTVTAVPHATFRLDSARTGAGWLRL